MVSEGQGCPQGGSCLPELCCVSQPHAAQHMHIWWEKEKRHRFSPLKPFQPNYPADIYICQDSVSALSFLLTDQNPLHLFWFPLFNTPLFLSSLDLCLSPLSLAHTRMWRQAPNTEWGLYRLPTATEVQGNGIRPAISFDVNFIVNNYKAGERPSHWGNIYMPPVNPLMGLIEPHSKRNTWVGATRSARSWARALIGQELGRLSPLEICSLDEY